MTYNVFSGTLNPAQSKAYAIAAAANLPPTATISCDPVHMLEKLCLWPVLCQLEN